MNKISENGIELDPIKYYINSKVSLLNFFHPNDPKNFAEERSWEWKSGVKGNVYVIKFDLKNDIDYTMFLLKQKNKSLNNNS